MDKISFSCRPLTDCDGLAVNWRDLESRADGGFFLSWDWVGTWLAAVSNDAYLLEGRLDGRIVVLGILCGKAPRGLRGFAGSTFYLHQTGDPQADRIAIEYNGLLRDRSVPVGCVSDAIAALRAVDGLAWDELFLGGLPEELADIVAECGLPVRTWARVPTARVDLASLRESGRDYLAGLSANTRAQIRRAIRRYEERGDLRLDAAADVETALTYFQALGGLHQRHWESRGETGAFASPFFVAFHRRLIEACVPTGQVELLRLSAGDTDIAYLYNFVDGPSVRYYASGIRYEDDNRLKPGLIAHAMCVERHLAGGKDVYDFMAGAARYKSSLGEAGPNMVDCIVERPSATQFFKRILRWVRDRMSDRNG